MQPLNPSAVPALCFALSSLEDAEHFGALLGRAIHAINPGALLLYGCLGAGKTTLTRAVVEALPGAESAEVASPSFTICNIYCTAPEVHHFDLYRLENGTSHDALWESLDCAGVLVIVEWPELLAEEEIPADGIVCRLHLDAANGLRNVELAALGEEGERCLALFLTVAATLPRCAG